MSYYSKCVRFYLSQYMGFLSLSVSDYILEPSQALSTIHQMASVHFNLRSNISL